MEFKLAFYVLVKTYATTFSSYAFTSTVITDIFSFSGYFKLYLLPKMSSSFSKLHTLI